MEHNQNTIAAMRLIIKVPYKSTFMTILDFFISPRKKWPLLRGNFGSWGCDLVATAIVERSKQESMYGLYHRTKKVATVERWPLWRGLNKSQCMDCVSHRTKKVATVERWPLWRGSCWRFNCIKEQAREQRQKH